MIKLITTFMLMFATVANAETIRYLVPGSNTGGFMMLSNVFVPEMEKHNVKFDVQPKGNCVNGMAEFQNTDLPTVMIYTINGDGISGRKGCGFTSATQLEQSVLAELIVGSAAVCTMDQNLTPSDLVGGKEYVVAVDVNRKSRVEETFSLLGINAKTVVYENSGKTVKGLISRDTDLSFTNAGKSNSVITAGGKCMFVVSDVSVAGIPTLNEVFSSNIDSEQNSYVLLGKNLSADTKERLLHALKSAQKSNTVAEYAKNNWLFVPMENNLESIVQQAVKELF